MKYYEKKEPLFLFYKNKQAPVQQNFSAAVAFSFLSSSLARAEHIKHMISPRLPDLFLHYCVH